MENLGIGELIVAGGIILILVGLFARRSNAARNSGPTKPGKNMRLHLTILFGVILFSISYAQNMVHNDLIKSKLKGSVQTLSTSNYEAVLEHGEAQENKLTSKYSCKYDDKGNQIEGSNFNSNGSLNRKINFRYNEKGNKIEGNFYKSDGSLDSKSTYRYDEKGNLVEENGCNLDGSFSYKATYQYDDMGNEIERRLYNADGSILAKFIYKYDDKGNQIESKIYNQDGKGDLTITSKVILKYDDKGNMIERNSYSEDDILINRSIYKYDSDDKEGNWLKLTENDNDKIERVTERAIGYYEEKLNPALKIGIENYSINRHLQNNAIANTFISSPNDSCYLIFNNTLFIKQNNAGDSWGKLVDDLKTIAIDPKNPKIFYTINTKNIVYKSMDGGGNWVMIQNGLPSNIKKLNKLLINPHNNSEVFLTSTDGIYKTSDAGFTWQPLKLSGNVTQLIIHSTNKNKFYALSPDGVFISGDAGYTWNIVSNTLPKKLVKGSGRTAKYNPLHVFTILNVNFPNSQFLLASTEKGVYKTTDDGKTWTEMINGISPNAIIVSAYLTDDEIIIGGGEEDKTINKWRPLLYKSDNNGTNWQKIEIKSDDIELISGIYKENEHPGIFINSTNRIAYIDTNLNVIGLNYGVTSHSKIHAFNYAKINDKTILYSLVENNNYTDIDPYGLWRSTNNGLSWIKCISYQHYSNWASPTLQKIFISPHNPLEIWSIDMGDNFVSFDGGNTWSNIQEKYNISNLYDLAFDLNDKNIIYFSLGVNNYYLIRFDRTTMGKTQLHESGPNFKIDLGNNKNIFTNKLELTNDGGWTWKSCYDKLDKLASDFYGQFLVYVHDYDKNNIMIKMRSTDLINTHKFHLITSRDNGENWEIYKSFDRNFHIVYINSLNHNNIILIKEDGDFNNFTGLSVLQTIDGSKWNTISTYSGNDENYYVGSIIIPSNKNNIYLFGNSGLLNSENNGKSWQLMGGIND